MIQLHTTLLFIFFGLIAFGQGVQVDTLVVFTKKKEFHSQGYKLCFPNIKTNNSDVDYLINQDLRSRFIGERFNDPSFDSVITEWADESVVYLDFTVTYNKNGLISFNISVESCGAYCTDWTEYFTYSVKTGKYVTIDELIINDEFKNQIVSDKNKQYKEQKDTLYNMSLDEESEMDEETYRWALENYESCETSFQINDFALCNDYFEIIHVCYLPRIIRNLSPLISLKYNYSEISSYLNLEH